MIHTSGDRHGLPIFRLYTDQTNITSLLLFRALDHQKSFDNFNKHDKFSTHLQNDSNINNNPKRRKT